MFDELLNPLPYVDLQAPEVIAPIPEVVAPEHAVLTGSPSSTTVDQDAPSPTFEWDMLWLLSHAVESGSIQLLGDRLVSWSSKRQKSAAISSTEAEYIALFGCCAQEYQLADIFTKDLGEKELEFLINKLKVDYAYLCGRTSFTRLRHMNTKRGNAIDDPNVSRTINVISRNEDTQLYGTILQQNYKRGSSVSLIIQTVFAIASGKIPPKTKASKKKVDSDATTKQKPPTVPKENKGKKSGKGKQKAK
ncbi:hypothetical protein Tco_0450695 [Tanacetum coccineum]